ncbi:MAG: hypothetical protein Q7S42_00320 [Candidatus Omnitrophota bacterium]|nr:hypothetical protein [Candidatus Omnitrophota bacterium]
MEIIMPVQEKKNAIYPVLIFKQAWRICWDNLSKLGVIYLIFNLPGVIISLLSTAKPVPGQKTGLVVALGFLVTIVMSSWGYIALLLSANKALDAQDYTIAQSISQTRVFLVKYLGLILSVALFIMGIFITGFASVMVTVVFLSKANAVLATVICLVLIIAVIASLVFFLLRWSLSALVCVFEGSRPIPALNGSFSLVKEHINPVVGVYVLMTLIYTITSVPAIIAMALSAVTVPVNQSSQFAVTIYFILLNIIVVPFCSTTTVVLYRKLKEAQAHVRA